MVFNALISNTDDHPRNHALIATTDKWGLSPAYDLTPNPLTSLEKRGDPRVRHALAGVLLLRADVTTNDARQREPMLRRIQLLPALTLALAG